MPNRTLRPFAFLCLVSSLAGCGSSGGSSPLQDGAAGSHPQATDGGGGGGRGGSSGDASLGGNGGSSTGGPEKSSARHVLMISIDGFHTVDLERYISTKPQSNLAKLASAGVRYTNASAPFPSDSFPSVLAWATGGTPKSTGVFYDISYDRKLSPPASDCKQTGTRVDFSEVADLDANNLDGGGGLDPMALPRDPANGCKPVYPHAYVRVNNIFEVVRQAGYRTAYSDKHLTYEALQGTSGAGVNDLYNPEISAIGKGLSSVSAYDSMKVDFVLGQIRGKDHAGKAVPVPALFGMNFQAVSVIQKAAGGGYMDAMGTPSDTLAQAIDFVDQSIGKFVDELKAQKLWDSTLVVVGASHGQSPIDPKLVKIYGVDLIPSIVNKVSPNLVAQATQDAVALLWLTDQSKTAAAVDALNAAKAMAGIDHVISGPELVQTYGDPTKDSRVPDIMVVVKTGTIYTSSNKKIAEHGGASDDDRKVALMLVGGPVASAQTVSTAVETRQIAPTILQYLTLDPQALKSVVAEGTKPLPGAPSK